MIPPRCDRHEQHGHEVHCQPEPNPTALVRTPEPSGVGLMLLAVAALVLWRRWA